MKVFITGINGFAGSYLAEALLAQGHEVNGTVQPGTSLKNIEAIKGRLKLFDTDILDENKLAGDLKASMPDTIVHLAAVSNVRQAAENPIAAEDVNVKGTSILLSLINRICPSVKFLFISSSGVYGQPEDLEKKIKEDSPLMPLNEYAVSKAKAEKQVLEFAQAKGIEAIVVRPSNHTGPRQSDAFFVPTVAKQSAEIAKGKRDAVINVGNLNVRREILDVRDVVKAYVLLAEKGKSGQVYNISSGKLNELGAVLKKIISFTEKNIEVRTDPSRVRAGDHDSPVIDAGKIHQETGWKPTISLEKTLKDTYEYWLNNV